MQRVNTPLSPPRLVFAALCALGILVIGYGAALEISRQKRGVTLVSPRQYRIRLVSAAVWIVILLLSCYAVTDLWWVARYTPSGRLTPESRAEAIRFLKVLFGSFSLLVVGLVLFVFDMRQTAKERRALESKRQQEFAALARAGAAGAGAVGAGALSGAAAERVDISVSQETR